MTPDSPLVLRINKLIQQEFAGVKGRVEMSKSAGILNEAEIIVEDFDLVFIGSGEGSKYLAWTLAREGQRVAVIEREYIGGSCPNIACLPSKNIIHSAKVASYLARSDEFGIKIENVKIDMSVVRDRKRKMVDGLIKIHVKNFSLSGTELIMGSGRFVGPKTLEVHGNDGSVRRIRGTAVIIGTGTHATLDPIPGLLEARPLTHIEALELDVVPDHLLVIGGGYIGLELAQAMRRFGSQVTLVERNGRLVHREDRDVSDGITELFIEEDINLVLNSTVRSVEGKSGEHVRLAVGQDGVSKTFDGTHLLVATGRTPNTAGIGLDLAGVEVTKRGYIKVNDRLETTAPGVWAIGECAGSPQFTHVAFDDFRVIRDNLAGGNHVTTGRQVPFCMFTDPEVARVGLSETEAEAKNIPYRLLKIPMASVLRTRTLSETRGFMKALIDVESDRILGFTAFGISAGEIMASVQIAMLAGLPYTALRDAVLTHPTLIEGLIVLFSAKPTSHNTAPMSNEAGFWLRPFCIEGDYSMNRASERIPGYTYGTSEVARSAVSPHELELLKISAGFTQEDEQYLHLAGTILQWQTAQIVHHWRNEIIASIPHLARHSRSPEGGAIPHYLANSNLRFEQWILDTCYRPYDQEWANYQQEIGLRHTSTKKNQTDAVRSTPHVPLRDIVGFMAIINETIKPYLAVNGHHQDEVDKMYRAWCKSMQMQLALWSAPYADGTRAPNEW